MSERNIQATNAPQTCPECDRKAVAILLDGDPQTSTLYGDNICEISRNQLPPEVGWVNRALYIHE